MRPCPSVVLSRLRPLIFILFLPPFLSSPTSALAMEKDLPLISSDIRVVEGNAVFESDSRKLEKELERAADTFGKELRADLQVLFDDNHMDWKTYFEIETMAFRPTDTWTRGDPSEKEYENLYQQNILFAINFRIG